MGGGGGVLAPMGKGPKAVGGLQRRPCEGGACFVTESNDRNSVLLPLPPPCSPPMQCPPFHGHPP